MIAMLAKMFGDDLVGNLRYLKKKFPIDVLSDTVAILFPRRSGKTEGMAIMIAVVAVSQPNGNCIMYNLTSTQAREFLQSTIKHLEVFRRVGRIWLVARAPGPAPVLYHQDEEVWHGQ